MSESKEHVIGGIVNAIEPLAGILLREELFADLGKLSVETLTLIESALNSRKTP